MMTLRRGDTPVPKNKNPKQIVAETWAMANMNRIIHDRRARSRSAIAMEAKMKDKARTFAPLKLYSRDASADKSEV